MAFADNTLRNKLQTRIISGVTGSTQFDTYRGKPHEKYEYMSDTEGDTEEGMMSIGCPGCQHQTMHIVSCPIMQRKRRKYYQLCKMYSCMKTNRAVSLINLMLLILLLILLYILCFKMKEIGK